LSTILREKNWEHLMVQAGAQNPVSGFHQSITQEESYFTSEQTALAYDSYIAVSIPFYWPALHFAARTLSKMFADKRGLRCIELGTGTGNFLQVVLEFLPVAQCLLVDHSEPMLAIATEKLHRPGCTVATKAVSFLSDSWTTIPGFEQSEIILASLALDHIHSDEALLALFERIYRFLPAGGCFVLAEKCANGNDKESPSWKSFLRMIQVRERHMLKNNLKTPSETRRWKHHILTEDCLRPLACLWNLVEKAGFLVHSAAGVPLPDHDSLDEAHYYSTSSVSPLMKTSIFSADQAYGLGMLFCLKQKNAVRLPEIT
jgi:ubiquinone/menaquinone biosynthesis C-methylase UbiE